MSEFASETSRAAQEEVEEIHADPDQDDGAPDSGDSASTSRGDGDDPAPTQEPAPTA